MLHVHIFTVYIYCIRLFVHSEFVFGAYYICILFVFIKGANNSGIGCTDIFSHYHSNMAESLSQEHESAEMLDIHCTAPLRMNYICLNNDLVLMSKRTQKLEQRRMFLLHILTILSGYNINQWENQSFDFNN